MTAEQKNSFLLYLEHEEFVNELSDEEAGKLIKGIFEYVKTGQTPSLSPESKMAFISIRQDLDRNAEKYEAKCEALRLNGLKGGRPKKTLKNENENNQMVFEKTKKMSSPEWLLGKEFQDGVQVSRRESLLGAGG